MRSAPAPSPSWVAPITIGAIVTFTLLFGSAVLQSSGSPQLAIVAACCCLGGFLPYGLVPAWIARRRDPLLSPGQGFAVAFIAVGLATVVWAAVAWWNLVVPSPDELRQALEDAQAQVPEAERLSAAQVDGIVEFLRTAMPFLPAVYATITSLFAGLVGLAFVAITRGRAAGAAPDVDTD